MNEYYGTGASIKHFVMGDGILYEGFDGHLLQTRGEQRPQTNHTVEPDETGIDPYNLDEEYPLYSKGYLLFLGYEDDDDYQTKKINCFAMPEYNQPEMQFVDTQDLKYEFFYENNYIVFLY